MLTAFQLGNFKAFADAQRIPIRPLTLIFGPNSGGKSSIIHSLLWAHEANRAGNRQGLDIHYTELGGRSVDLGGFRQYVHRHDLVKDVEWSVELSVEGLSSELLEIFRSAKSVTVKVYVRVREDEERIRSLAVFGKPFLHRYEILVDETTWLWAAGTPDGPFRLRNMDCSLPVSMEIIRAIAATQTLKQEVSSQDYESASEAVTAILADVCLERGLFLPTGVQSIPSDAERAVGTDMTLAVKFWLPSALHRIVSGLEQHIAKCFSQLQYLGPLRSYPPRHLAFTEDHDSDWFAGGGYAWEKLRDDNETRAKVNAWIASPERLRVPYELRVSEYGDLSQLEGRDDIGPLYTGAEKIAYDRLFYELDDDWEPGSEDDMAFRDALSNAESILIKSVQEYQDWNKIRDVILVDKRTNTTVSHRDVGIGLSQMLPVLVGAYGSRDAMIMIEQPEIHIHPALQAELADVFIESALGVNRNRFLLETHSEHLILRILRRIRESSEGALPDGIPTITPKDVQVIYVDPSPRRPEILELPGLMKDTSFTCEMPLTGSRIIELPITEDGEFERPWPQGFFAERAKELF